MGTLSNLSILALLAKDRAETLDLSGASHIIADSPGLDATTAVVPPGLKSGRKRRGICTESKGKERDL